MSEVEEEREEIPNPEDCYDEDGVDISLIHWTLSLTPMERLHLLQETITTIVKLRNANAQI
jgi:hypothetical protein